MTTHNSQEDRVKLSGKITDKAREFTDSDEKLGKLFFSLLEKPVDYLKKIVDLCLKK